MELREASVVVEHDNLYAEEGSPPPQDTADLTLLPDTTLSAVISNSGSFAWRITVIASRMWRRSGHRKCH